MTKKTHRGRNRSDGTKWTDLNFKVTADFHRDLKLTAVLHGMSMKELLEASHTPYRDVRGSDRHGARWRDAPRARRSLKEKAEDRVCPLWLSKHRDD
jgi:hypothetical protein